MSNVTVEAIMAQNESVNTKKNFKKVNFSETNYLNCRLTKNEMTKTLKIRLLPFFPEGGSPFHMIHTHTLKVPKKIAESGFKSYVCLRNTKDIDSSLGDKCPICEIHDEANKLLRQAETEADKKRYSDLEYQTRCKNTWVVRCIERGHEDEGVKFWKFNVSQKKDGVYDKLFNLFKERKEESGEEEYNIFDLENGKDLIITLSKDNNNKVAINIVDAGRESPLSKDPELAEKWINDDKKWNDVYVAKPYEYLKIVSTGGVPFFDKENKIWVSEEEILAAKEEETKNESITQKENLSQFSNFDSDDLGETLNLDDNNPENLGF